MQIKLLYATFFSVMIKSILIPRFCQIISCPYLGCHTTEHQTHGAQCNNSFLHFLYLLKRVQRYEKRHKPKPFCAHFVIFCLLFLHIIPMNVRIPCTLRHQIVHRIFFKTRCNRLCFMHWKTKQRNAKSRFGPFFHVLFLKKRLL